MTSSKEKTNLEYLTIEQLVDLLVTSTDELRALRKEPNTLVQQKTKTKEITKIHQLIQTREKK